MKDLLLLVHPVFGAFSMFAAIWLFVEVMNVSDANRSRMRVASLSVAVFMFLTWIASGYWYVLYYAADKAVILAGPWPFAHKIIMETKEHVFFITLILSMLLPIVVFTQNLLANRSARILVLWIIALIVLSSLAIEAGGSLIAMAVKLGLLSAVNS